MKGPSPHTAPRFAIGLVGASGYSGIVAARLVASHPHLTLAFATSDKWAGALLSERLGPPFTGSERFLPNEEAGVYRGALDAVLLATPVDVSFALAPLFAGRGISVIDLSGAFRLADREAYPRWYGMDHPAPEWLGRAHYGLPELFGSPQKGALVANPGCYPTATLLSLAPLLEAGLIEPDGIIVDAKSGVSGAGRQSKEEYSFVELDGDLRAYRLLAHQHTPEILQALTRVRPDCKGPLTFTPHLIPVRRGLLATSYGRPRAGVSAKRVAECLADRYDQSRFVRAVAPDEVRFRDVVGTNLALVGATANADVVIAVGAIDNLVKGAAGQAVQNLNLLFGLDEGAGLETLRRHFP